MHTNQIKCIIYICMYVSQNWTKHYKQFCMYVIGKTVFNSANVYKMSATHEIGTQEIIPHWHPRNMMLKVLRNMRTATTRYYYLDLVIDNAIYIIMMCKMGGRNHLNPACILTSSFHVYKLFCELIRYKIKILNAL